MMSPATSGRVPVKNDLIWAGNLPDGHSDAVHAEGNLVPGGDSLSPRRHSSLSVRPCARL